MYERVERLSKTLPRPSLDEKRLNDVVDQHVRHAHRLRAEVVKSHAIAVGNLIRGLGSACKAPTSSGCRLVLEWVEGIQPSPIRDCPPWLTARAILDEHVVIAIDAMVSQTGQSAAQRRFVASNDAAFTLVLQKLGSADHVEAHLLRLDATDRQMRFCGMVSDQSISLYCEQIDWSQTIALGCFIDGKLRGMAELKMADEAPASIAELGITVERSFQNKGIGTALLRRMLTIARNRFVGRVYMICLLENHKMQHVAGKLEANLTFHEGEVEGCIWPSSPTYLSLVEEASMDGQALWRAMLDTDRAAKRRSKGQVVN